MSEREDGPNYKEKLDITQVFLRQRDRTNFSAAARDGSYDEYVRQTMRMLPLQWQQWVRDQSDRYEKTEMVLMFRKNSGVRMGTQTDPCLRDRDLPVKRLADNSIDWSDPNILSPILKEKTTTDYEIWDEVISEAAEHAGISWQQEKYAGDGSNYSSKEQAKTPFKPAQEGPE